MTKTTSSEELAYMLKWLRFDIVRESEKPGPSSDALRNMMMQRATITWALEKAVQREASEATLLSFWTENVADRASCCGF